MFSVLHVVDAGDDGIVDCVDVRCNDSGSAH